MLGTVENKLKAEVTKNKKELEKLVSEKAAGNQQRAKL